MMRQLIRAIVEFSISKLLLMRFQRNRIGRALDLLFEQLMNALVTRIGRGSFVPLDQELMPLGIGENWKERNRLVRIIHDAFEQSLIVSRHALDPITIK